MPFRNKMDSRKLLARRVIVQGMPLAEACRAAEVARRAGRLWTERAREVGIENLCELSRRPHSSPSKTPPELEAALVEEKALHPHWSAKKLVRILERDRGLLVPVRTADRILARNGLVRRREKAQEAVQRFERELPLDLAQIDFKGMPKSARCSLLTVLDDASRCCLAFEPLPDKLGSTVFGFLWDLFGETGLPREMLMDNGDCWAAHSSRAPSWFESRLMLLGIYPIHGRIRHPQTQGKVERFHGTAKLEMGLDIFRESPEALRKACRRFVDEYNWVRPHEALGGGVPGASCEPSPRKRPDRMPGHEIPEGADTRKVDSDGFVSYKGQSVRLGKGLIGERVVLEEEDGEIFLFFAGYRLCRIKDLPR